MNMQAFTTIVYLLVAVIVLLVLVLGGLVSLTRQMHKHVKHLVDIVDMGRQNVQLMTDNAERIDALYKLWERVNDHRTGAKT